MKPDKIHLSLILLIILTTFSWFTSCTHVADIANLPEVCFTRDIKHIFNDNCNISGCHGGGGESSLAFDTYENIRKTVVPYNPDASQSYQAIISKWGNLMPPSQPLSQDYRTLIRLWIEQGANPTECTDTTGNNGGSTGGATYIARACFTRDISPVLVSRCATLLCHDAVTHKEGYDYTTYTSTMKSVSAGNPSKSKLYQVITLTSGESKMPPKGTLPLSAAEIDSIGKWIGYGALKENCGEVCDTINPVSFSGTISPIILSSCTGCHSGASPGGGIPLTNYADVHKVAINGSLMNSLRGTGVSLMPKGGSFSPCRIRQFEIWVNNGALNN